MTTDMDSLAGRTAFITGGAQGIGLGIARALAREGVRVALADINEVAIAGAREELAEVTETAVFALDVRERDRYAEVADKAEAQLGPVSLLFNNAGIIGSVSPAQMTYEMWDWVLGINLNGVVNGLQTFIPRIIERGSGGYVVNTASVAGLVAGGSGFLYTTSKYAVVGMSESLHLELAHHNIGVSVLCPGPVATHIVDNTAQLRPAGSRPPSARVAAKLDAGRASLKHGTSPDAVGDMVVAAIKANQLYIYTDTVMGPAIKWRTQVLLDALPGQVST